MTPRLALSGITKRYATTLANDGVDLTVLPGEIHALLGENGAGKSTLVKIIYGVVQPDAGQVAWEGRAMSIATPNAARALGIGMVFQHFSLFESLTVAENIALGLGMAESLSVLSARIAEVSGRYGLAVEPSRHVHHLSVGERQRVEIVRCLLQEPKLLIMDEPTSVLTPQEVDDLFVVLRRLSAEGCSILYISHKLDEIMALCETATVLRAGRVAGHARPRESSARALAEMMTGTALPVPRRHGAVRTGEPCLVVRDLTLPADDPFGTTLRDVSLELRTGEIVGIAGVAGNGQREFLAALSGERRAPQAGQVRVAGHDAGRAGPLARRRMGLAFIPEERLGRGAVGDMSLAENGMLTAWQLGMVRQGFVRAGAVRRFAQKVFDDFKVRAAGIGAAAASLSGGNMQKFIVGREVEQAPRVLLAAHPTWGVDIGATLAIRQTLIDMAERGVGVLVVSEDLAELFEISDRIAVLSQGRLSAPHAVAETTVEQVGLLMGGHHAGTSPEPAPALAHVA
jgi:simple sugar transport system ATP-binding protein